MEPDDLTDQVDRYSELLKKFGYSPRSLDLGDDGRQELRYRVLAEPALRDPKSSVLDVGCGFGDLYTYLRREGWEGRYLGLDIVPGFMEIARSRHPEIDVRLADITDPALSIEPFDYVIAASGVFNARLRTDNAGHTRRGLAAMVSVAKVAVSVDFLSTRVDFQKAEAWHTDPAWLMRTAREWTPRMVMRFDYMPYEFAAVLYVDSTVSERRVFRGFDESR